MIFQKDSEEENNLNYQLKKIMHMIQLQIMDIESTLHYIQKKHTVHQIKEVLSQIYNIFNQAEVVFKHCKALFLHTAVKKLMNCFGIIYFMLTDNIENGKTSQKQIIFNENNKKDIKNAEEVIQKDEILKTRLKTQHKDFSQGYTNNYRPFGGVYLYNENYTRNICSNKESKSIKMKNEKKTVLTKDEFNKQIMDQLNDNLQNIPHPDEMLDIFTFKFKYGREKQVVTFHDQLQSIAKFFKDSQNEAFQFLNKTKDQNSNLTYNDTFSDIMSQVRLQKEIKLQQFTKKIKNAFNSIKTKTQDKWNEIQTKLQEVKEIQNSIKPPENKEMSTQTSYNIDQEIKYLKKKIEAAEEKYKLMHQLKRKEVQENTIMQLQMENQLSLKARQLIYLKIAQEQNKVVIANLNKKIKVYVDNHKRIKQTISLSSNSNIKEEGIKRLVEIVQAEEALSECASEEEKMSLQSLRKQKKMAKKLVIDARRRSLVADKQQYAKRFTQQMQGLTAASKQILQKWGLSNISQQADMQTLSNTTSVATNKNIQLTRQNSKKNTTININFKQGQSPAGISSHSIKSANQQGKTRKQTRQKTKTNSQFLSASRPTSFRMNSEKKQEYIDDSLFGETDSDQSEGYVQNTQEDIKRLQEMYKRQMNRTKNGITQRKTAMLSQMNQKTFMKSKFKTDQSESRKSSSNNVDHYGMKSNLVMPKPSSTNSRYASSSFRLSAHLQQMNAIDEKEQEKQVDLQIEMKNLQAKNKQLLQLLDKKSNIFLTLKHKQIDLAIEPLPWKKVVQVRKILNLKSQVEEQTHYSEMKTDKKGQSKSSKEKRTLHFKQNKTATQFMSRPTTQSKLSMKLNTQSFHVRRGENSQKSKTRQFAEAQSNLSDSLKNTQQVYIKSKTDLTQKGILYQKFKTLQTQKGGEIQIQRSNLIKKTMYSNGKQNKGGYFTAQKTIPQRISQNFQTSQQQKKEEMQEEIRIKQLAINCKTKKQFKNKIYQIHWQKCGKSCKHLQQYMRSFSKYRQQAKSKLKMHIQNLHESIGSPSHLPAVNKRK